MVVEEIDKQIIAKRLNVAKSTIYRELKRNSDKRNGLCRSTLAKRKYAERLEVKTKSVKFNGS